MSRSGSSTSTAIPTAPALDYNHLSDTEEMDEDEEDEENDEDILFVPRSSRNPLMVITSDEDLDSAEGSTLDNNISMRDEESDSVINGGESVPSYPHPTIHPDQSSVTTTAVPAPVAHSVAPASDNFQSIQSTAVPRPSTSNEQGSTCEDHEDESSMCPICFETWSNAGEHRIVSLKCGHLFGKKCVERWLRGQGGKCPQCNAKATKKDIRVIYARCLKAEDTTDKVRLAQEIEKLKKEKSQFEKEKAQLQMKNAVNSQMIKNLQQELVLMKESINNVSCAENRDSAYMSKKYKLSMFRTFDFHNKSGSCRVMAFNEWMNMLVVSMQSPVDLFPGFGIKKINTLDFKFETYVHLHSKQIRDIQFNPNKRDLLLSVAVDRIAKITNISSNSTVAMYNTACPLWCCCWNSRKSCEFFVGTCIGTVYHFDTVENTSEPINTYQLSGSGPVVSISYVSSDNSKDFHLAGLIVTRLTSISFLELSDDGVKEHNLPIEGSFSHTAFDPGTRHILATCRPTDKNPHARHILCELKVTNLSDDPATISNVVSLHQVFSFQGSTTMKVLSRACLTTSGVSAAQSEGINPVVIFSEESTTSFKLYESSTSLQIQSTKTNGHVIDILPVQQSEGRYLAMLTEKSLLLYKWIEQIGF